VVIEVPEVRVSLQEAVATYLFNSQLVARADGRMVLVAPSECAESEAVRAVIDEMIAGENPVAEVRYVDVRESMRNGGGPACLRLRVLLNEVELAAMRQGVLLTEQRYVELVGWVKRHYRERIGPEDLRDPKLLEESRGALDELTRLLGLGALYSFQGA
jgi:succinylarginine dihydrolase